jgi:hypothetical protein
MCSNSPPESRQNRAQDCFSVPSVPQKVPFRQTHRNNFPFRVSAVLTQASRVCLTELRNWDCSYMPRFSYEVNNHPMIFTALNVFRVHQIPPFN